MRKPRVPDDGLIAPRRRHIATGAFACGICAALALLAGCGQRKDQAPRPLSFEQLADTASLTQGKPLLEEIEPFRETNGMLRVRGRVGFPDGTRVEISLYDKGTRQMRARVQVIIADHRFVSPPMMGPGGPLPKGAYRFEYMALFNEAWQTSEVMRRTDNGRALRGPGVSRDRVGGAAFYLVEERAI